MRSLGCRKLIQYSIHILEPVGTAVAFGKLDSFVDHNTVGYVRLVLELIRRNQQDSAFDRAELLATPVQIRLNRAVQLLGSAYRSRQQSCEVFAIALFEALHARQLLFD